MMSKLAPLPCSANASCGNSANKTVPLMRVPLCTTDERRPVLLGRLGSGCSSGTMSLIGSGKSLGSGRFRMTPGGHMASFRSQGSDEFTPGYKEIKTPTQLWPATPSPVAVPHLGQHWASAQRAVVASSVLHALSSSGSQQIQQPQAQAQAQPQPQPQQQQQHRSRAEHHHGEMPRKPSYASRTLATARKSCRQEMHPPRRLSAAVEVTKAAANRTPQLDTEDPMAAFCRRVMLATKDREETDRRMQELGLPSEKQELESQEERR
eukprot:CAMPEP_0115649954 /NCGR_PEP_ID=MMETSP0272-20121206/40766_1 /TAXON_ID=71861 /ORGANISM="Scrippsiella trochoidea, Strain CCMP3099" /LENGTH=264 /DNA_ID=CAMNT_0003087637 /DNA_START=70 /DNA_END=860 /DNA_ORIENTATION=-